MMAGLASLLGVTMGIVPATEALADGPAATSAMPKSRPDASGDAYQVIASPCLNVRAWHTGEFPSTSLTPVACVGYGAFVHVICWYSGQSINGDVYWDRLLEYTTDSYAGIAADFYINTGSYNPNDVGIPPCSLGP
jgi:hypothetical protein